LFCLKYSIIRLQAISSQCALFSLFCNFMWWINNCFWGLLCQLCVLIRKSDRIEFRIMGGDYLYDNV